VPIQQQSRHIGFTPFGRHVKRSDVMLFIGKRKKNMK
jgi:hypothetical protein